MAEQVSKALNNASVQQNSNPQTKTNREKTFDEWLKSLEQAEALDEPRPSTWFKPDYNFKKATSNIKTRFDDGRNQPNLETLAKCPNIQKHLNDTLQEIQQSRVWKTRTSSLFKQKILKDKAIQNQQEVINAFNILFKDGLSAGILRRKKVAKLEYLLHKVTKQIESVKSKDVAVAAQKNIPYIPQNNQQIKLSGNTQKKNHSSYPNIKKWAAALTERIIKTSNNNQPVNQQNGGVQNDDKNNNSSVRFSDKEINQSFFQNPSLNNDSELIEQAKKAIEQANEMLKSKVESPDEQLKKKIKEIIEDKCHKIETLQKTIQETEQNDNIKTAEIKTQLEKSIEKLQADCQSEINRLNIDIQKLQQQYSQDAHEKTLDTFQMAVKERTDSIQTQESALAELKVKLVAYQSSLDEARHESTLAKKALDDMTTTAIQDKNNNQKANKTKAHILDVINGKTKITTTNNPVGVLENHAKKILEVRNGPDSKNKGWFVSKSPYELSCDDPYQNFVVELYEKYTAYQKAIDIEKSFYDNKIDTEISQLAEKIQKVSKDIENDNKAIKDLETQKKQYQKEQNEIEDNILELKKKQQLLNQTLQTEIQAKTKYEEDKITELQKNIENLKKEMIDWVQHTKNLINNNPDALDLLRKQKIEQMLENIQNIKK